MNARACDRLIPDGAPDRIGLVIGRRNADGSPPHVVKWPSGGRSVVVIPVPYAGILPGDNPANGAAEPDGDSA
jgi:hypothetical protein